VVLIFGVDVSANPMAVVALLLTGWVAWLLWYLARNRP
jgi:hypothetical protein